MNTDADFVFVGCIPASDSPPVPSSVQHCADCKTRIWLSDATAKDVEERGAECVCLCIRCMTKRFEAEKGGRPVLENPGQHTLDALKWYAGKRKHPVFLSKEEYELMQKMGRFL